MELLQLRYFRALAYEQHLSRTAEKLHISQPALSITIRKLEDELGAPLFSREGRGLQLNDFGRAYLTCVEESLLALEKGQQILAEMQGLLENKVSLALVSPPIWQNVLKEYMASHPQVALNQHALDELGHISQLLAGDFDFYLGSDTELPKDLFSSQVLYQDDMVLLIPEGHSFTGLKGLRLEEAKEEKFISLHKGASLRKFIDSLFKEAGFAPKIALECDYTLRDNMVTAGYGISVTTKKSALQVAGKGCSYVPLTHPSTKRILSLSWRKNRYLSKAAQEFRAFVEEYYISHSS